MALTLAAGLFGAVRPVCAQQMYADLDRDGIRDVIKHDGVWDSAIHVWLSKTASMRVLRSRLPLVWVRVVDLDGDGRLDVIGADKTTRVHIWHYRGGRLRPARSAPVRSRAGSGSSGSLAPDRGIDEIALPVSGTDPPPCDAPGVPGVPRLCALSSVDPLSPDHPTSAAGSLPPSRAPPTTR